MKLFTFSALATLASAALWAGHLPSAYPINGAFIAMVGFGAMTLRSLATIDTQEDQ